MNKKLFRPKLGREWAILWSKQEKKKLVDYFIEKCKEKEYLNTLCEQHTMSVDYFLRSGRKINKN
jgi:hypothetical protein